MGDSADDLVPADLLHPPCGADKGCVYLPPGGMGCAVWMPDISGALVREWIADICVWGIFHCAYRMCGAVWRADRARAAEYDIGF